MSTFTPSTSASNDSTDKQNPLLDKRKSPFETPQTSNLNTNPNNEEFVETKKSKISPDDILMELKKKPANFNVERAVCWRKEERVPFMLIAKAFDAMSNESGTTVVADVLCNMLRTVIETTPEDLLAVVYLLTTRTVPDHIMTDVGFGYFHDDLALDIAEACGTEIELIQKHFKEVEDLGLVAKSRLPVRKLDKPLTVVKVLETFKKLPKEYNYVHEKESVMKGLLEAATGGESLHLIRLLQRRIQGGRKLVLPEEILLTALGHAALYSVDHYSPPAGVDNPPELEEAAKIMKEVYFLIPVYDKIVPDLLKYGVKELPEICSITPAISFKAMLPKQIVGSVSEILDKFQDREFICEYEYPGHRVLIHFAENGVLEIYNMYGTPVTSYYFDVGVVVARAKKPSVKTFILDCVLVAYDREKEEILPSTTLDMRREAIVPDHRVHVCLFAFDCLYLNGKQFLQKQLDVRRMHLHENFLENTGHFHFAKELKSTSIKKIEEIDNFLDSSSCPRLILKTLTKDATYEPGKKSENWLILEKGYVDYVLPSLYLVPIAAFPFSEERYGYTFVLACYDDKKMEFQSVCVITPDMLTAFPYDHHFHRLQSKVIPIPKTNYKYYKSWRPDLITWFETTEVWEVKVHGLYAACHTLEIGTVDPIQGLIVEPTSLVRVLEGDNLKQAATPDEVVEIYKAWKHSYRKFNLCLSS